MSIETLRELNPKDADTVRGWLRDYLRRHRSWWSEAYGVAPQNSLEDVIERDWEGLLQATRTSEEYVRILEAGVPFGIVRARIRTDGYMGIKLGVLSWIYVAEAARGQGAAMRLIDAFHEWACGHDVQGYEVYVTSANAAAIRLYERSGFRIIDHRMLH